MAILLPEYAPTGLIGVLTPQANTTVEPELSVMMPDGVVYLNGRLRSDATTIRDRLIDYMEHLDQFTSQFGTAPIRALAVACTGTAYFVGPSREDAILDHLSQALGIPVFSAATAAVNAIDTLGAKRVAVVSPYDADVDAACSPYWQKRGWQITRLRVQAKTAELGFHPIYTLRSQDADRAILSAELGDVEAVLILGTGLPTLPTLVRVSNELAIPVMSCMSCLGWQAAGVFDASLRNPASLRQWSAGVPWANRLNRVTARSD